MDWSVGDVPIVRSLRVSWAVLWRRRRKLIGPIATSAIFGVVQGGILSNVQSTLSSEPVQLWHVEGVGRGLPAADSSTAYFLTKQHEVLGGRHD